MTKRFRNGVVAVNDVSLALGTGVLALLGPNGAGKTTLMQMIATITKPSAGRILFDGEDIAREPDRLRRRLGYLPQDFGVYDGLTALDFLTYFAALKGIHSRTRVTEMLELVNLHAVADRAVGGFSGGMKQRLGIAQALINDPALLIVDEPTAGLDPEERLRFRNILSDIGFERLVIFSTHIVSDIRVDRDRDRCDEVRTPAHDRIAAGFPARRCRECMGGARSRSRASMRSASGSASHGRRARAMACSRASCTRSAPSMVQRASSQISRTRSSTRSTSARRQLIAHAKGSGAQRVLAIAWTDVRIRMARTSSVVVLVALCILVYVMVPDLSTGRALMKVNGHRALYNSVTIALATSSLCAVLLGMAGFYLTSNTLRRDVETRTGYVIASTPVRNSEYLAGKLLGNIAFLTLVVIVYVLNVMAMQLLRGEAPVEPLTYAAMFLAVVGPVIVVVSSIALMFECVRPLSGRIGDIAYFFLWVMLLAVPASTAEGGQAGFASELRRLRDVVHHQCRERAGHARLSCASRSQHRQQQVRSVAEAVDVRGRSLVAAHCCGARHLSARRPPSARSSRGSPSIASIRRS